jgi:hypothetical protein
MLGPRVLDAAPAQGQRGLGSEPPRVTSARRSSVTGMAPGQRALGDCEEIPLEAVGGVSVTVELFQGPLGAMEAAKGPVEAVRGIGEAAGTGLDAPAAATSQPRPAINLDSMPSFAEQHPLKPKPVWLERHDTLRAALVKRSSTLPQPRAGQTRTRSSLQPMAWCMVPSWDMCLSPIWGLAEKAVGASLRSEVASLEAQARDSLCARRRSLDSAASTPHASGSRRSSIDLPSDRSHALGTPSVSHKAHGPVHLASIPEGNSGADEARTPTTPSW